MQNFNLIDSPWIPVRWMAAHGSETPPMVSLNDAFTRSADIADLDCAPHERIALTRLLVCITHAALGAPEDDESWGSFGDNLAEAVSAYLKRADIYPHFNLLGEGPRFLQENVSSKKALVPLSKMVFNLATGNNATLLDHAGSNLSRAFNHAQVALALLTFQNFYPLFGTGFKGRGPCSDANAIHCIIYGVNLLQTLCLNLLDHESIRDFSSADTGRPIWECADKTTLEESTKTYLGRLVPRHRSLKLRDQLDGFYHQNVNLEYSKWEPSREPSTSVILNKKGERKLLSARLKRAIWRDLHVLTAIHSKDSVGAPPVLRSHTQELNEGSAKVWAGALITDLKAKIHDTIESSFTVPRELFNDDGRRIYAAGIEYAETISQKLDFSVKVYWMEITDPDPKKPAPAKSTALASFWHQLDQSHGVLIQLASKPEERIGKPAIGTECAEDAWTKLVRTSARNAFDAVCPRSTPRQIQAYANGIKPLLRAPYPKSKETKSTSKKASQS